MIGFVNDSSTQVNNFQDNNQDNAETLMQSMKQDNQLWSDLLHFTGGALNLSKCNYHITHYSFTDRGTPVLTIPPSEIVMSITTADNTQEIQQLQPDQEYRTLGVYKCPSGTTTKWRAVLLDKSNKFSRIISLSHCTPTETQVFLYFIYYPSICHAFATSHFTKNQLDNIQRKALGSITAKLGFCRTMHLSIRY